MSSRRVICEKISTRESRAWSLGRSLSSRTIFPEFSIRCMSVVKGGPGSAPWKR